MAKKKPENYLSFQREQIAEILGLIVRSTKPKDKDPNLRKAVYFQIGEESVSIYATNEIVSLLYQDVACGVHGEVTDFAVDLIKLSKFAASSKAETLNIMFDEKAAKLIVKAGATINIGYWDGDAYKDMISRENPIEYPDDEDYSDIGDIKDFRNLARIMLGCTDVKKPHLAGVYTDGEGKFMATDQFKGMSIQLKKHHWGFEGLIPNDFFGLLDAIDGDVHLLWQDNVIWARDVEAKIVISSFTRPSEQFPSKGLDKYFDDIAETGTYLTTINAEDLSDAIKQLRGFFGDDDLTCMVSFKKKMILNAVGSNDDKMKVSVKYAQHKDSDDLEGFEFKMQLGVLGIIPTLFTGTFTLRMINNKTPMYSNSTDLGIKLLLTPYTLED